MAELSFEIKGNLDTLVKVKDYVLEVAKNADKASESTENMEAALRGLDDAARAAKSLSDSGKITQESFDKLNTSIENVKTNLGKPIDVSNLVNLKSALGEVSDKTHFEVNFDLTTLGGIGEYLKYVAENFDHAKDSADELDQAISGLDEASSNLKTLRDDGEITESTFQDLSSIIEAFKQNIGKESIDSYGLENIKELIDSVAGSKQLEKADGIIKKIGNSLSSVFGSSGTLGTILQGAAKGIVGLAGTVATLAVGALTNYIAKLRQAREEEEAAAVTTIHLNYEWEESSIKLEKLFETLSKSTAGSREYAEAMDSVIRKARELGIPLDEERASINGISEPMKELIESEQKRNDILDAQKDLDKQQADALKRKKEEAVKYLQSIKDDSEYQGSAYFDNWDVSSETREHLRKNAYELADAYFDAYQKYLEEHKGEEDAREKAEEEGRRAFGAYYDGITGGARDIGGYAGILYAELDDGDTLGRKFELLGIGVAASFNKAVEENIKLENAIVNAVLPSTETIKTIFGELGNFDTSEINEVFDIIARLSDDATGGLIGMSGTLDEITSKNPVIRMNINSLLNALGVAGDLRTELMSLSATDFKTRITQIIETKHLETFQYRWDNAQTEEEKRKTKQAVGEFQSSMLFTSPNYNSVKTFNDRIKDDGEGKKTSKSGGKTAAQIFNEKQEQEKKEKEREERYAKERANAQEKYEKSISLARIKAMSDAGKRALAELAEQNKRELETLNDDYDKLIEAEKKRQQDKFEAEEDAKAKSNKNYKKRLWSDSMYDNSFENGLKEKYDILVKYTEITQTSDNAKSLKEILAEYDGGIQLDIDLEGSNAKVTEAVGRLETLQNKLDELRNTDLSKLTEEEKKLLDIDTSKLSQAVALMKELEKINLRQKAQEDFRAKLEGYSGYYEQRRQMEEDAQNAIDRMNARLASEILSEEERSRIKIAIGEAENQLKEGLAELDFEEVQRSMDWDNLFSNLEVKSVNALKAIEEQILSLLNSENLTAEQAKTLADQLSKVRDLQIQKAAPFAAVGQSASNLSSARREYNDVASTRNTARFKVVEKNVKKEDRKTSESEARYQKALQSLVPVIKDGKQEFISYAEYLELAKKKQGELTDAQESFQKATKKAGSDLMQIGSIGLKAFDIAEKLGADTSSYEAQSAKLAFEGLSEMGSALSNFDLTNPASLLSISNYMDMASGLIDTITGVLGIFGVGKGNMAELQKEIDNLTNSNALLTTALDDLAREMEDADLGEASKIYDRQMQTLEQILSNDRKILQDAASQWEKGSKSISTKVNNDEKGSQALRNMGFSSLKDFLGADADTIRELRAYKTDDYNNLLSAIRENTNEHNGGEKIEEYLNKYLDDAYGKADEYLSAYQEKITGMTFDSMYDNFKAKLKDMSSSASDFADDFKAYLNDAVVEGLANNYMDRLKEWYKKFAEAAKDGLTENEKSLLLAEKDQIIQDAINERDELVKAGVLSDDTSSNASGTTKGFAGMSQSTADELNGRFAQLQISGQQTANNTSAILGILQSQTQETTIDEVNTAFDSLSGVMNASLNIQNQSLLELRGINQNTLESMKILGETRDLVTEIRNKTSNL